MKVRWGRRGRRVMERSTGAAGRRAGPPSRAPHRRPKAAEGRGAKDQIWREIRAVTVAGISPLLAKARRLDPVPQEPHDPAGADARAGTSRAEKFFGPKVDPARSRGRRGNTSARCCRRGASLRQRRIPLPSGSGSRTAPARRIYRNPRARQRYEVANYRKVPIQTSTYAAMKGQFALLTALFDATIAKPRARSHGRGQATTCDRFPAALARGRGGGGAASSRSAQISWFARTAAAIAMQTSC